ncbi:MAG: hypothetical protein C4542_02130 [Dehalococcoidia bacterium]|nr:MAG: hypothetical protein C4542_02130 [Dehalococcoidia bacterium]
MELKCLALPLDDGQVKKMERAAGLSCMPFPVSLKEIEKGMVAVVLRSSDKVQINEDKALESALRMNVPVVVLVGDKDRRGKEMEEEAQSAGVPPGCLLYVNNGKVVDGAGNIITDAVSQRGIGIKAVVAAARSAAEKELYPEPVLWSPGEPGEDNSIDYSLWEKGSNLEETRCLAADSAVQKTQRFDEPLGGLVKGAEHVVLVVRAKGGVGASTICASLAASMSDYGALHLEVGKEPGGYIYYGSSPESAAKRDYVFCDSLGQLAECKEEEKKIVIIDTGEGAPIGDVLSRASCVIMVTDTSVMAFERARSWVESGWPLHVLVVNRMLYGVGLSPEVYAGELGVKRVIGVIGGSEEEVALNSAQRENNPPVGISVEYDTSVSELSNAVCEILKI